MNEQTNLNNMTEAENMPKQWAAPSIGENSAVSDPAPRTSTLKMLIIVFGTLVGYLVISGVGGAITGAIAPDLNQYAALTINAIPLMLFYVCMIIFVMNKKKVLTAKGNGFGEGIMAGMFMLVIAVIASLNIFIIQEEGQLPHYGIPTDLKFGAEQIWCIIGIALSAGICEELMCRGLILNALRDRFGRDTAKGTIIAVVLSGIIFGCLHFVNLKAGVSFQAVLIQVVSVCGIGIYLGAVYCRCGNIKVTMLLHFLMDIAVLLPQSMQGTAELTDALDESMSNPVKYINFFLYAGIALFLLRKSMRSKLFSYSLENDSAN